MSEVQNRQAPASGAEFSVTWERCDSIPGWLTAAQAAELWAAARSTTAGGTIIEIGSHQGRSTVVLASAAAIAGATVVAIDPFLEGPLFGGQPTRIKFEQHITEAGLSDVVTLEVDYSANVLARWSGRVDMLYVDGKHDYWSCTRDLDWARSMPDGAPVFVHDAFSSVGVTASLVAQMLRPHTRLRYRGRTGSLAAFVKGRPSLVERFAVAKELGWFSRNVFIKILLRLRLRPVANVIGHSSPYDPY